MKIASVAGSKRVEVKGLVPVSGLDIRQHPVHLRSY